MAVAVLDIVKLEDKLKDIVDVKDKENFLFDFLDLYDIPKSSITKLKTGTINLSDNPGDYHLKNKLFFRETEENPITDYAILIKEIEYMSSKPRYVFVTDFETVLAQDTMTKESLDISFEDLPQYFDFFLAWNGVEKADLEKENPLDVKAAERFARLYELLDEINKEEDKHHLNLFLTRVIFCLFAEDTGIFEKKSFTNGLKKFTKEDGSNINEYLSELFKSLDNENKEDVPTIYKQFPYVNGKLFRESHQTIKFDSQAWDLLIECGEMLNWSEINPDIFGSMIQTIASNDTRGNLGMHYTSVSNIMKVIKPLFLDGLYDEFENSYDNKNKLNELYTRLGNIKFFDPACGSGNFLIITYKELRKLEMEVFDRINELSDGDMLYIPMVTLDQFYGIEIDEFASEVAQVSLWIADHQMNMALEEEHMELRPTLPLKDAGDIRHGNALRIDWEEVCPHGRNEEVYIFGNPPYLGARLQDKEQKEDMEYVFKDYKYRNNMDYISAWFYLGALYIKATEAELAFVSTNSINTGEQVYYLWHLLMQSTHISFAHSAFKWSNNAKNNAGVVVVIIGLASKHKEKIKTLFTDNRKKRVSNINPYLVDAENIIVKSTRNNINGLPKITFGNMPNDKGNLILNDKEFHKLKIEYPELLPYIRKFVGSREFINGIKRYCFWITDEDYEKVKSHKFLKKRFNNIKENRLASRRKATKALAETPHKFGEIRHVDGNAIIIPSVSSAGREYIPMGFVDEETIVSNLCLVVYDAPLWLLGLLQSKIHMAWVKGVAGTLGSAPRYSASLCYNTFPVVELNEEQKNKLTNLVLNILDIRAEEGKTMAQLYSESMPIKLKNAHEELDLAVEQLYRKKPFDNEQERLSFLLEMYSEMIK
ncbi:N-6 DNA methylase [Vagococcus lutrae]|uniref:class I SAM-dependent DNA methyltransferase n=1 Tax=Vagococcus lutrae TaxID=81947 RepID=UPI002890F5FF|nr:DNA methyltransferase [Vagococcus lutrae]MDT2801816.1 N-6 DNA methylase [Vagococcus lutrae]